MSPVGDEAALNLGPLARGRSKRAVSDTVSGLPLHLALTSFAFQNFGTGAGDCAPCKAAFF